MPRFRDIRKLTRKNLGGMKCIQELRISTGYNKNLSEKSENLVSTTFMQDIKV